MQYRASTFLMIFFCLMGTTLSAQSVLLTSMGNDVEYRISRTKKHLKKEKVEAVKRVDNAALLFNALEGEPLKLWVNFSHGNSSHLFGKDTKIKAVYYSSGLMLDSHKKTAFKNGRALSDLKESIDAGEISFAQDALIVLHACAVGSVDMASREIFAWELSKITGATVIAGQHQTEPLVEDYQELIYTNKEEFILFQPDQNPMLMGDVLFMTETINQYMYSEGYDFDDYDLKPMDLGIMKLPLVELLPVRRIDTTKQSMNLLVKIDLNTEEKATIH